VPSFDRAGRKSFSGRGIAMNERRTKAALRSLLILPLTAVVVCLGGCTSLLFTAAYIFKGNDAPAECDKLREKRVVVVCRPLVGLKYNLARVDQDLAQEVGILLRQHVPKIKVVDHRKVAEWMDENTWDEYVEVGKALKADLVVGIDLEHFDLHKSQTLFQGRANTEVKVYDCQTGKLVFRKRPAQAVYPPNREIQTSDIQEADFRRQFVRILADQLGRHFYDHDRYDNFAMDAKSIE
jgi:hypothetical protein